MAKPVPNASDRMTVRERAQAILDKEKNPKRALTRLKALPKGTLAEEEWLSGYMESLAIFVCVQAWQRKAKRQTPRAR